MKHLNETEKITRRKFLERGALLSAATLPVLLPGSALGKDGTTAPSNRLALAFCGLGYMNTIHLNNTLPFGDVQIVAVADTDQWRRENFKKKIEEYYALQKPDGTYKGCDVYIGFHELLDRPDVDGLMMAIGERWHGPGVVLAARAGKHVYVEKPNALTIGEAVNAIDAVRRFGTVCQVGYQQRSWITFQHAASVVQSGALGKIKKIYMINAAPASSAEVPAEPVPATLDWETWVGPSVWRPFNRRFHQLGNPIHVVPWCFCSDYGLGQIGSSGTHSFDLIQWALGLDTAGPTKITPAGHDSMPYLTFDYPGDITVQVVPGRLDPKHVEIPNDFDPITSIQHFGALFVGENGWLHVGRRGYLKANPVELIRNRPLPLESTPKDSRARYLVDWKYHVRDWLDSIRLRRRPVCDIDKGSHSTMAAILGHMAAVLDRPLRWDPAKNEFLGDDEANRLRRRAFREPWGV